MPDLQNPETLLAILDNLQTAVCVLDRDGKIVLWNQGAAHTAGYMQHEVLGRPHGEVMQCKAESHSPSESSPACAFMRIFRDGCPTMFNMYLRHKRGYSIPVLMKLAPVRNQHGSIIAAAVSVETQNYRSQQERTQRHSLPLAGIDVSTGVANHNFTVFRLRENLASFAEYHIPFGILRVRADGFDHFHAAYGPEAANALSLVIAQTLSNSFRPSDFVGRWGDNEFLVILTNCGGTGVRTVFERIQKVIPSTEIRWWGELLSVNTSMTYTSVELGDTVELLLRRAAFGEELQPALAASSSPGAGSSS